MQNKNIPLAEKIRPKNLDQFSGQKHLLAKGSPIYQIVKNKKVFSMIFWGPPGCGKTTLARIIARETELDFFNLSAVSAKKDDLRKIINKIENGFFKKGSVVFLDEIHRFNKAQQDYLLPFVEDGTIVLIGATTENPSFEVIGPLLSRCRVFVLKELSNDQLKQVINRALKTVASKKNEIKLDKKAERFLIDYSCGDARTAINTIEFLYNLSYLDSDRPQSKIKFTIQDIENVLQKKALRYDKQGEEHYDTVSAFIKSMRASDSNAALYYLARMIEAGEDPLFIARRMVIFASEDIGQAQPTALVVANEVFRACETIGYPECAINLAHGTVYLANAPKDRSSYNALRKAQKDVKKHGNLPIPMHLRNAPTKLMKEKGYGKGYDMYPDKDKNLLPDKLKGRKYFV